MSTRQLPLRKITDFARCHHEAKINSHIFNSSIADGDIQTLHEKNLNHEKYEKTELPSRLMRVGPWVQKWIIVRALSRTLYPSRSTRE